MNVPEALDTSQEPRQGEMKRFLRFVLTGIIAAVANFGSRFFFSRFLSYSAAVALAYLVGVIVAFTLARLFVFEGTENSWQKELVRFALVNGVAFVQVWGVSLLLNNWLFPVTGFVWHREAVAHLIGLSSPIVTSYFGHKHFSFRG